MTDFLPPFDTEQFRLMVLDEPDTDISFGEAVHRIFLPFAAATWAVVVTFLVGLLAFWWLVEWSGEDRPPGARQLRHQFGPSSPRVPRLYPPPTPPPTSPGPRHARAPCDL